MIIFVVVVGSFFLIFIIKRGLEIRLLIGFLFVNMVVVDFLVVLIVIFVNLYILYGGGVWVMGMFGNVMCLFMFFMFYVIFSVFILSLLIMLVDCYFVVVCFFYCFEMF